MDYKELGITTKSQLNLFLEKLSEGSTVHELSDSINQTQIDLINRAMKEENKTFEEVKKEIKSYVSTSKDIVIYISFEPTMKFIESVSDMLSVGSKNYLLDFRVDQKLIGGAILSLDGKLYDYSLKLTLDKLIEKQTV